MKSESHLDLADLFQFQYGSIKSREQLDRDGSPYRFQFQYGSIKSRIFAQMQECFRLFQFQYGSIKSVHTTNYMLMLIGFNSNMVRLKEHKKNNHFKF